MSDPSARGGPVGREDGLTVLVTAIDMDERAGSTMYVRDLVVELASSGHRPVVYTPSPGSVSADLEALDVEVIDRLDRLDVRPDVIHGNHTLETAEAVFRLPGTPAIFVCHGLGGWMAEPPRLSAIAHWVAVGEATAGRLAAAGLPPERCWLVPNGVDTDRFRLSGRERPERPRRALVFSNNAVPGGWVETVVDACATRGIELDIRGKGVGHPLEAPEDVLGGYDMVFARGRCAREAISCGCAVVVADMEGQGSLVTADNVVEHDDAAFGWAVLTAPHDAAALGREIDRYDPADAAEASRWIRATSSVHARVARLVELYRDAMAAPPPPAASVDDLDWLLRQLPVMSRIGHDRDAIHLAHHLLHEQTLEFEARLLRVEPALAETRAALAEAGMALDEARRALAAIESTRTFRLRERVLRSPGVGRWARAVALRRPSGRS